MTSGEIVTIISALSVALVAIITAWRTGAKVDVMQNVAVKSAAKTEDKLEVIHQLTNSNLTAVKADLTLANDRIAKLESLLNQVVAEASEGNVEKTVATAITAMPALPGRAVNKLPEKLE